MGLLSGISKIINDYNNAGQSYNQGENWARATIEKHRDKEPEFEVDEQAVIDTAQEYAADPYSFYNGFRETWNEHVDAVEATKPENQGFWSWLLNS